MPNRTLVLIRLSRIPQCRRTALCQTAPPGMRWCDRLWDLRSPGSWTLSRSAKRSVVSYYRPCVGAKRTVRGIGCVYYSSSSPNCCRLILTTSFVEQSGKKHVSVQTSQAVLCFRKSEARTQWGPRNLCCVRADLVYDTKFAMKRTLQFRTSLVCGRESFVSGG